jgi:replicative DNA helicase
MEYSKYAQNIYISEGIGDIGVEQVRQTVKKHILFTGRTPVVIIDYLQILAPYSERATDKQNTDKAVMELKRISRDYKTPVICISSFNRANYKEAVTMEAFKESGAIEYSSDVLIGLQLKGAGEKNFDANEAKRKDPREIELVILKNRNGRTGGKIIFNYYPLFNYFREA